MNRAATVDVHVNTTHKEITKVIVSERRAAERIQSRFFI